MNKVTQLNTAKLIWVPSLGTEAQITTFSANKYLKEPTSKAGLAYKFFQCLAVGQIRADLEPNCSLFAALY